MNKELEAFQSIGRTQRTVPKRDVVIIGCGDIGFAITDCIKEEIKVNVVDGPKYERKATYPKRYLERN